MFITFPPFHLLLTRQLHRPIMKRLPCAVSHVEGVRYLGRCSKAVADGVFKERTVETEGVVFAILAKDVYIVGQAFDKRRINESSDMRFV